MLIHALIVSALAGKSPAPPCDGCTLDVPKDGRAIPMLVVLGDPATHDVTDRLRSTAVPAGWAVLSLACPRDERCDAGWATWTGDPKWITDRVYEVSRTAPIDLARVYLVAGSTGSTFVARHAPAWADTFAAVVIAGGGEPPATTADCPTYTMPAYFLASDREDTGMAGMRAYFDRCKQQVVWDAHGDGVAIRRLLAWLHKHLRVTTVA